MNNLPNTIIEIIKDENFQTVMIDWGETLIDIILRDEILRDIPILGSFWGLGKAAMSIPDKLFTNKLLSFLMELKDTDANSRNILIEKIDTDPKYKTKVGEKLLYILDKCEDTEKAAYIGKLYGCCIKKKMSYEQFLRASKSIELTFLYDLKIFIKDKWNDMPMEEAGGLISSGLMIGNYTPSDGLRPSDLKAKVSPIGKLVQQFLDEK